MEEYQVEHKEKITSAPGGKLCQVYGKLENAKCSIALVEMASSSSGVKHFHDNITEIYLFAKGNGQIIINDNINQINEGDIYIIPKGNVHFIKTNTNMKFACICTPPWEEKHEFIVEESKINNNIEKCNECGIIQMLSNQEENCIKIIELSNEYIPNENEKKYLRVYYFISGEGILEANGERINIEPGMCFEFAFENEKIINTNKLKFLLVCELNL